MRARISSPSAALLYEMLTGQRAFRRDTPAETMTAILHEDPADVTAARADLTPSLDRIVRHCLEKNPQERFQTARDVAFALSALSGSASAPALAIPARRAPRVSLAWVALSVVLAGIVLWQGVEVPPRDAGGACGRAVPRHRAASRRVPRSRQHLPRLEARRVA